MPDRPETKPASLRARAIETRAATRRRKAARERRIVAFLNVGVSISEIAVREKLTERRIRQLVQEALDKRTPATPAAYAAIQVSRLNEAMLVAYSAMRNGNLAAVDRVVKLTRELDRYHGFAAPDLLSLSADARISGARALPLPGSRNGIVAQGVEMPQFAEEPDAV